MQSSGSAADLVSVQITGSLAKLAPSSSESFIYKVHKQLRCINENAYDPEIVAIGPYHRGKQNLDMMEEHKLRYLKQLLDHKGKANADEYILLLRSLQLDARRYYAEPIKLTEDEFVKMLLLDGCFIIEVIRKFEMRYLRSNNDPIFQMDWILNGLQRDLMLFENQLPFDILCKLFDLIEAPGGHDRFKELALSFFQDLSKESGYRTYGGANPANNIKHLLGLIHDNWLPSSVQTASHNPSKTTWCFILGAKLGVILKKHLLGIIPNNWLSSPVQTASHNPSNTTWCFIPCAKLLRYGVIIKKHFIGLIPNNCLPLSVHEVSQNAPKTRRFVIFSATELLNSGVNIKKAKEGSLFDITFESGVLQIPPLRIEDRTETLLRNLVAYEEYSNLQQRYMIDYARFIDCLINTENDVKILCKRGIIDNWLGDGVVVSDIFNKITNAVTGPSNSTFSMLIYV